jgi:predicted Zn finger-like uncharacterized protein
MITLSFRGLDANALIAHLSQEYSTVLKRIWRNEYQTIAVFARDETYFDQAILIVLEHEIKPNICKVECAAIGNAKIIGSEEGSLGLDAESIFLKAMRELASRRGWELDLLDPQIVFRGIKCPHCGAVYSYRTEQVSDGYSVRCQNCDKPFIP